MRGTNRLLKAQQRCLRRAEIEWDGQRAEIDLLKAVGVAPGTGAPIHLRREICLWDRCLTPHWEPMGESLVELVEGSEEYREVAEGFKQTAPGYYILHIQRVQNRVLWVPYCWQRRWMEEKNPPGELNERLLYHGTRPENRRSIQEIGLRNTCRKVGIYGQGLYFAVEAAQSADYAKPDAHGHRFMFQVRVLTGQFTQGKEDMALPPEKPDGGGRYDSVVNVVSRPSIFVTFFDDLPYPEYLITFRGTRPPQN
ncbi:Poly ADP-ribose polymerase 15 [Platysternon megacephalum]|uniref:Poly [ADP-ribose] polymerase n=1 Tax=Platysternon megacephalum TaxID=55544 RepID=A0A4D9DY06_9SAUR|nr:Poly ADP-ribose polymerase 15 [Platysternon megacephalum]